jgi:predicted ATPase
MRRVAAKATWTVDHHGRWRKWAGNLAQALRASWLPKITNGWFFRAESFFSVARPDGPGISNGGSPPPDFLSHSHGEGFLRFFEERCRKQGIYFFDEPESRCRPHVKWNSLKLMRRMEQSGHCQVIMATHSPVLMAYPNAQLLRLTKYGWSL